MSNKRRSKRQVKLPVRYENHVVGSTSKKITGIDDEIDVGRKEDSGLDSVGVDVVEDLGEKELGEYDEGDGNNSGGIEDEMEHGSNTESENHVSTQTVNIEENVADRTIDNTKITDDISNNGIGVNAGKKSYANMVNKNVGKISNKLDFVPTQVSPEGKVRVVFDEELVKEGSEKWQLTLLK
ncbi:hypothetical protein Tco_0686245 [Tanacetum coccineum]